MRLGFCLHWREVSFYVSPQGEGRSPWFSVGAMTYQWDCDRVEGSHAWLHIGPWISWSWTWKKPTVAQTVEAVAARVLRRMVAEESIRQMHRQEAEALRVEHHRTLAEAHARAEPPTSACSRCGRTFPVADLYTGQRTQRQACDSCLTAMVAAGTAKRPAEF